MPNHGHSVTCDMNRHDPPQSSLTPYVICWIPSGFIGSMIVLTIGLLCYLIVSEGSQGDMLVFAIYLTLAVCFLATGIYITLVSVVVRLHLDSRGIGLKPLLALRSYPSWFIPSENNPRIEIHGRRVRVGPLFDRSILVVLWTSPKELLEIAHGLPYLS
jgi:hypothetical protein